MIGTQDLLIGLIVLLLSNSSNDRKVIAWEEALKPVDIEKLELTVVYDNEAAVEGLDVKWGFSCFVEGLDQSILFDVGGEGSSLMSNMAALGIDPKKVNIVLLSHEHMDHTGGLARFLSSNADVSVFALRSFPASIKDEAKQKAAKLIEVEGPRVVSENAMTTGEMGTRIREQSLLILTNAGLIIITGCAHPGIVNIVEKAKELTKQEVILVIGGFHLLRESDATIQRVISSLKKLGVRYVSPGHCTGESARKRFLEAYGERYISCGVGLRIRAADLSE